MISRLNYTGRKRITRQMAQVTLEESQDGQPMSFEVEFDLAGLNLPPEAPVRVEASRSRAMMRFDWGSAGNLVPPPPEERLLTDIPHSPHFTVMALSPDGSGRLLALGERLQPARPQNPGHPLLPLQSVADLGQEVWRVDFDDNGGGPVLKVNHNSSYANGEARRNGVFRGLVMPEALRVLLTRAFVIEDTDPVDPDGAWADWMRFVRTFFNDPFPEDRSDDDQGKDKDEVSRWINDCVREFAANRFKALDYFERDMERQQ